MAERPEGTSDNANSQVRVYNAKHPITRERKEARAAEDHYSMRVDLPVGPITLGVIRQVVDAFEAAGVPPDAPVQLGYPTAWASWRRILPGDR